MADMAGLALGAISLGIEVCKGIITYANAVRSHTDDLQSLDRRAQTLAGTLDLLSKTIQFLRASATNAASTRTIPALLNISHSISSCGADLNALQDFVTTHAGCVISHPGFRDRCRDGYRALKYGFRGSQRAEMEQRITNVNSILLLAMQNLEVDMSLDHASALAAMMAQAEQVAAKLVEGQQSLASIYSDTTEILNRLDTIQAEIAAIDTHAVLTTMNESRSTIMQGIDSLTTCLESVALVQQQAVAPAQLLTFMQTMEARTAFLDVAALSKRDVVSVQRLVARPHMLKEAITDVSQAVAGGDINSALDNKHHHGPAPCTCRLYRTTESWQARLGVHRFSLATRRTAQHYPHCRYSKAWAEERQTDRRATARLKLFGTSIEAAFQVSFTERQGAGGFSIAPFVTWRAVVDERSAPAFRIVSELQYAGHPRSQQWTREHIDYSTLFEVALVHLQKIYTSGRGSPTDVDAQGENILHKLARMVGRAHAESLPDLTNKYCSVLTRLAV
ncbi:uncharacterized protein B0I36DRAFT_164011 [Microdochium trichocladiopsis]|uniref:Fungal N-terminal domain-containing protein n=1 Tax=Microdochium trichocladiopsis TaxID=1682393 RepID=A0A9P8XXR0_9PEZI|nr:uncharacterized protein B0I36DRAFT_164011 [Microdochium trichocladiopsis]KAH7024737.1 hypothetical protein B0I36DRAFT_164011 [Microdochium trichocladiopsis]